MLFILEVAQAMPEAIGHIVAAVPDPGSGTAPPGSAGLTKILKWAAWIASAACVLGVIGIGCYMGASVWSGNHHNNQHFGKLGVVLMGAVLVGSASGLAGALI